MKLPDFQKVENIIRMVAETEVMPRFNRLEVSDISTKNSPGDLVTIADVEAEKKLSQLLPETLPDAVVIGEEAVFADESLYERLNEDSPVFIVDPIDGTSNFTEGKPEIGIVVALAYKGETVAGWIYNPVKKVMLSGEKGAGAFVRGKKCRVKNYSDLSLLNGAVGRNIFFDEAMKNPPAYWGSACFNYMLITTGVADYSVYRTASIKPWDHAAGVLLHTEAGGYTAYVDESPYRPFPERKMLISAPDKEAWDFIKAHCVTKKR